MVNKKEMEYERTISSSYMKMPVLEEDSLDVRIMLQRRLKGMIPVERCYMNGKGQYWYDISGKQDLDSFVKMNSLEYSLFEILMLRICEQLEILEWNLLDTNGLVIDPEFIFLNKNGEEIWFVFYPQKDKDIVMDLQKLLEYLLSKLNHADRELVQGAYEVYELFVNGACQVQELKNAILKRRIVKKPVAEEVDIYSEEVLLESKEISLQKQIEEKLNRFYKKVKELLIRHPREESPMIVYPEDKEEVLEVESHPTICVAVSGGEPRGVLIYEGIYEYPDFELEQSICVVGKSPRARLQIQKETISNFHAKIDYSEGYYIEDMNSTNGTFVNDELLNYKEKKRLNSGDVIRFADIKYRFL